MLRFTLLIIISNKISGYVPADLDAEMQVCKKYRKMSYTPKKRLPQSLCCASPFFILFIFLFLIFVPVAFVIAATGSSAATSDFRI